MEIPIQDREKLGTKSEARWVSTRRPVRQRPRVRLIILGTPSASLGGQTCRDDVVVVPSLDSLVGELAAGSLNVLLNSSTARWAISIISGLRPKKVSCGGKRTDVRNTNAQNTVAQSELLLGFGKEHQQVFGNLLLPLSALRSMRVWCGIRSNLASRAFADFFHDLN